MRTFAFGVRSTSAIERAVRSGMQVAWRGGMLELAWIVDDDVNVQRLVARALRDLDVIALPFFDAESALMHRNATVPSFAIVDVTLPRMDGFQLAHMLRREPRFERLPLLMMTARQDPTHEQQALAVNATFLPKPFRLPVLREAVRELRAEAAIVRAAQPTETERAEGVARTERVELGDDGKDGARTDRKRARVLIVDDDPDIRDALCALIDDEGHEAVVAADAFEALSLCGPNAPRPDLALIDVMMPGLDGIALAARLRAAKPLATTPIVMMSAFDSLRDEAARVGAVASLKKPFQRASLVDVLARALSSRSAE